MAGVDLAAGAAWAQPYAPNDTGVTMGHWHLNSVDVEANKKIFVGMGGTHIKAGVSTWCGSPASS